MYFVCDFIVMMNDMKSNNLIDFNDFNMCICDWLHSNAVLWEGKFSNIPEDFHEMGVQETSVFKGTVYMSVYKED